MTPDTEKLVLDALRRVVRQAFDPPTKRHRRSGWAGSPCDITCQPCAIEHGAGFPLAVVMQNDGKELMLACGICEGVVVLRDLPGVTPGLFQKELE